MHEKDLCSHASIYAYLAARGQAKHTLNHADGKTGTPSFPPPHTTSPNFCFQVKGPLEGIQEAVEGIQDDLSFANRQISAAAEASPEGGGGGPHIPDVQNDETSRLLGKSRGLRTMLTALASADPDGGWRLVGTGEITG